MRKNASGAGQLAGVVGELLTLSIVPKASFTLDQIVTSGDLGATLTMGLSGECPIIVDAIDAASLAVGAFHAPPFDGGRVYAGVPVVFTYTAGSTSVALRITLSGEQCP